MQGLIRLCLRSLISCQSWSDIFWEDGIPCLFFIYFYVYPCVPVCKTNYSHSNWPSPKPTSWRSPSSSTLPRSLIRFWLNYKKWFFLWRTTLTRASAASWVASPYCAPCWTCSLPEWRQLPAQWWWRSFSCFTIRRSSRRFTKNSIRLGSLKVSIRKFHSRVNLQKYKLHRPDLILCILKEVASVDRLR